MNIQQVALQQASPTNRFPPFLGEYHRSGEIWQELEMDAKQATVAENAMGAKHLGTSHCARYCILQFHSCVPCIHANCVSGCCWSVLGPSHSSTCSFDLIRIRPHAVVLHISTIYMYWQPCSFWHSLDSGLLRKKTVVEDWPAARRLVRTSFKIDFVGCCLGAFSRLEKHTKTNQSTIHRTLGTRRWQTAPATRQESPHQDYQVSRQKNSSLFH